MSIDMVDLLSLDDTVLAVDILGAVRKTLFKADVVIAPDGEPYLYRWYLTPLNARSRGLAMFHIQVKSDPERPLHDHPWDNFSTILAGGYDELYQPFPELVPVGTTEDRNQLMRSLRKGDTAYRKATTAHRLILPPDIPYTMTLFCTGPKVRDWGFWFPDGWHHNKRHVQDRAGVSIHVKESA